MFLTQGFLIIYLRLIKKIKSDEKNIKYMLRLLFKQTTPCLLKNNKNFFF